MDVFEVITREALPSINRKLPSVLVVSAPIRSFVRCLAEHLIHVSSTVVTSALGRKHHRHRSNTTAVNSKHRNFSLSAQGNADPFDKRRKSEHFQ